MLELSGFLSNYLIYNKIWFTWYVFVSYVNFDVITLFFKMHLLQKEFKLPIFTETIKITIKLIKTTFKNVINARRTQNYVSNAFFDNLLIWWKLLVSEKKYWCKQSSNGFLHVLDFPQLMCNSAKFHYRGISIMDLRGRHFGPHYFNKKFSLSKQLSFS